MSVNKDHLRLITTGDGSLTLFSEQFNAHYHSTHGALQESNHVFIKNGLEYFHDSFSKTPIRILEYGFGTGLNALLSLLKAKELNLSLSYTTLEKFPLPSELYQNLNFLNGEHSKEYLHLHRALWNEEVQINDRFALYKKQCAFEDFHRNGGFDIIYFDAFAPSTQPELWEESVLQKCYDALDKNGILVTYCAKGSFKRTLKKIGFSVQNLPGPPGKREMTRAIKVV